MNKKIFKLAKKYFCSEVKTTEYGKTRLVFYSNLKHHPISGDELLTQKLDAFAEDIVNECCKIIEDTNYLNVCRQEDLVEKFKKIIDED